MYCFNCGQQIPDGSRFCSTCGTPQVHTSADGTTSAETVNIDGTHSFIPAMCPNCNAHMNVNSVAKIARCEACGTECLVQDAIKTLNVRGNVQVSNATINITGTNANSLLKRVEIMLSDGDFSGAMQKCDAALDSDPTNGEIYFYMLMADLKCKNREELKNYRDPFDENQYYVKAMQFGDDTLKKELRGYTEGAESLNDVKKQFLIVGDKFFLGTYKGKRLWWKVISLQQEENCEIAIAITADKICDRPFNDVLKGDTPWCDSELREWLNNDFYNECFTEEEKRKILVCDLENENNPEFNTPGGEVTADKVFLLSIDEAYDLFRNDKERSCGSMWWLRTVGSIPSFACVVDRKGELYVDGESQCQDYGVRPAICYRIK